MILKYDPVKRKKLITIYLRTLTGIGLFLLISIPAYLKIIKQSSLYSELIYNEFLSLLILCILTIPSIYIISIGLRIIKQGKYPLDSMILFRDQKLLEGSAARRIGIFLAVLGTLSLFILGTSAIVSHNITNSFKKNPFSFFEMPYRAIFSFLPNAKPYSKE